MIRHIVVWRLAASDPAERETAAATIAERLTALPAAVPAIRSITVGRNVAYEEANWDVAVVADFDGLDGLDAYQRAPAHLEAAGYIRSVTSERASIDFEL